MKINEELYNKSLRESLEIVKLAKKLSHFQSVDQLSYARRRETFRGLYKDDEIPANGIYSFHPEAHTQVWDIFMSYIKPIKTEVWRDVYRIEVKTIDGSPINKTGAEKEMRAMMLEKIAESVTNQEIILNIVPEHVKNYVNLQLKSPNENEKIAAKAYQSPKLSKILTKLVGEKHEFMSWFTNKKPTSYARGVMTDYKIVISILPHHLVGMSYYSSFNSGGEKWNSYAGTSCQDPSRNGDGINILSLPAILRDEAVGVAYLTKVDDQFENGFDIFNPIYEARCLIRVAELKNGKTFFISLKPYGTTDTMNIIQQGLKNHYENLLSTEEIVNASKPRTTRVVIEMVTKPANYQHPTSTCEVCHGLGHINNYDEEERVCLKCNGEGEINKESTYYTYQDNSFWFYSDPEKLIYKIPKTLLISKGWYSEKDKNKAKSKIGIVLEEFYLDNIDNQKVATQNLHDFNERLRETYLNLVENIMGVINQTADERYPP